MSLCTSLCSSTLYPNTVNLQHLGAPYCPKKKKIMSNLAPLVFLACLSDTLIDIAYCHFFIPCPQSYLFVVHELFVIVGVVWVCFYCWPSLGSSWTKTSHNILLSYPKLKCSHTITFIPWNINPTMYLQRQNCDYFIIILVNSPSFYIICNYISKWISFFFLTLEHFWINGLICLTLVNIVKVATKVYASHGENNQILLSNKMEFNILASVEWWFNIWENFAHIVTCLDIDCNNLASLLKRQGW
jgi:hypothetical protein